MAEELEACPFCGGAVRFHSDEDCHGCHYIECSGCKAMFDFSHTTDPENQCDSLHELQCGIAHTWNTRAKLPSKGGEAVAEYQQLSRYENWDRIDKVAFDLGKLGSCPEKFRAIYTRPADQVAEGVKPEPIQVEAVAVTREDEDGELYLDWLIEGGISALEVAGQTLLIAHGKITDGEGGGEVYTAEPAHSDVSVTRGDSAEIRLMLVRVTDELDALNCSMRDQIDDMADPEEEADICDATDKLIDEARALLNGGQE
jgi:hypothetical protein